MILTIQHVTPKTYKSGATETLLMVPEMFNKSCQGCLFSDGRGTAFRVDDKDLCPTNQKTHFKLCYGPDGPKPEGSYFIWLRDTPEGRAAATAWRMGVRHETPHHG